MIKQRERASDLSPRMRELVGYLTQPRTVAELSTLMAVHTSTIRVMMNRLKQTRDVRVIFDYGATTYELSHEPAITPQGEHP